MRVKKEIEKGGEREENYHEKKVKIKTEKVVAKFFTKEVKSEEVTK